MGKLLGLAAGLFIVFSIGIFAFMYYMIPLPIPAPKLTLDGVADSLLKVQTIEKSEFEGIVTQFKANKDSLEKLVAELRKRSAAKDLVADSLQRVIDEKTTTINRNKDELNKISEAMEDENTRAEKAKDLAKTLGSMDAKQIAPIVTQLDNETVIAIYEQMNSRSKKNLLLGLPRDRAATITKKMLE